VKSELHGVRSTLEAFCKTTFIDPAPAGEQKAAGIMVDERKQDLFLHVRTKSGTDLTVKISSWE